MGGAERPKNSVATESWGSVVGAGFCVPPALAAAQRRGELSRTHRYGGDCLVREMQQRLDIAYARSSLHVIGSAPGRVPGSPRIARWGDADCSLSRDNFLFYSSYIVCSTFCNSGIENASSAARSPSPPIPTLFHPPAAGPFPAPPTLRIRPSQAPKAVPRPLRPHQGRSKAGASRGGRRANASDLI